MSNISDKLIQLSNIKSDIKTAINNKGQSVGDDFSTYANAIDNITTGDGDSGGNDYYKYMWDAITNNNTDYSYLFYNSKSESIDVSNLDTSNVTNMSYMFYMSTSLTSIDASSFDTSKVTNMSNMFQACNYLTSLNVSSFNTSEVTNMSHMFSDCNNLTSIDVSSFDTSNVTNMSYMFAGNVNPVKFTTIEGINDFDMSNVTTISNMFSKNWTITSLDVSGLDIGNVKTIGNAFNNCKALVDFQAPKNINAAMYLENNTALSHDSLMSVINNLATTTSTKKLTLGSTNLAKLSEEEKAIATNKGWTLA